MPSRKIFFVLILCIGAITSIFLLTKTPFSKNSESNKNSPVSVESFRDIDQTASTTADWQKILIGLNSKDKSFVDLTKSANSGSFDNTTLTAQMARDFMSQYLLLKKSYDDITPEDISKIVDSTLSMPQYTQTKAPVYIASNLNINQNSDLNALKKYQNDLKQLINGLPKTNDDPLEIARTVIKNGDANGLTKLDPMITVGKSVISTLVNMSVPKSAIQLHLDVLNASSNLLANMESIRAMDTDPVNGFVGVNKYGNSMISWLNSLKNISQYLEEKLGSN